MERGGVGNREMMDCVGFENGVRERVSGELGGELCESRDS
jgi:hypothetical protein